MIEERAADLIVRQVANRTDITRQCRKYVHHNEAAQTRVPGHSADGANQPFAVMQGLE